MSFYLSPVHLLLFSVCFLCWLCVEWLFTRFAVFLRWFDLLLYESRKKWIQAVVVSSYNTFDCCTVLFFFFFFFTFLFGTIAFRLRLHTNRCFAPGSCVYGYAVFFISCSFCPLLYIICFSSKAKSFIEEYRHYPVQCFIGNCEFAMIAIQIWRFRDSEALYCDH